MSENIFYINRKSPSAIIAMLFMAASAVIRIIYYSFTEMPALELWVYLINTVAAAVLFIIAVVLYGNKLPQLTAVPVLMGVIFFIVKSFTFPSRVHTTLCIILYLAVLCIYSLTVFGIIRTKYLLYPLFGLPLLYHIFIEDMQLYVFAKPYVPFFEWLPEISVLCIMAALFCISVSLKSTKKYKN